MMVFIANQQIPSNLIFLTKTMKTNFKPVMFSLKEIIPILLKLVV